MQPGKNTGNQLNNTPLYQLKELEGNLINPEVIYFTQSGMIGGLRNKRDGYAYFGYKKTGINNKVINDFILKNDSNTISNDIDHVFRIGFSKGTDNIFYLRNQIFCTLWRQSE